MVEPYTRLIIRWRYAVVLLTLVVVALTAWGGRLLEFSNDYRMFFGEDNPQLLEFERMQNRFNKNDNVLFVITPKSGKVFSTETLKAVMDITEQAWQIPYSIRVDSVTNFQHTTAEGDELIVRDLVTDPDSLSNEQLLEIQSVAINEPMLINRLISPDSRHTGVNVTLQLSGKSLDEVPEAVGHARDIKSQMLKKYPDIEIRLVGIAMMNNAFPEASINDAKTLYPLALIFIIITLLILLRGISGTVITFFMVMFSIMTAMGLAGWFGVSISPPVISAPIMILTMAIADAVHLLVTMRHEMVKGKNRQDAMTESMRINFWPVFVTTITTVLGFLSLNFSDAPPFHDLGNIAALGVGSAFIYSITFLPAMVAIMPQSNQHEVAGKNMLNGFADFVVNRKRPLLLFSTVITFGLIAMIPNNELNDNFVKYFDKTIEFRQASDYATENLTGVYYIDYSLRTDETGGISDPEFLRKAEEFARYLRAQPQVMHVQTITDTFKRLNKNMHGDDPAWYRLPRERDLAAQYLLLYELSLPYGLDLNNQVDIDKRSIRMPVTLETMSSGAILELERETLAWARENLPGIEVEATGPTVMFAHISIRNIHSMLIGTSVALVLISMVLILFFRSFRYGLISLLPNLLPAGAAFGIWALLNGQVGIALSVVTGMTLGIVVDDTVHFMSKYLRARRERGMNAEDAVRYAFNSVGIALLVTSIVLIAGFMILAQSHFVMNAESGLLTSVVIALALIIDFILLPPLLIKLEEKTA